jgi:GTPase SAR1 family protein
VKTWVKELHSEVGPDINIVVAGNKSDKEGERKVNYQEAVK